MKTTIALLLAISLLGPGNLVAQTTPPTKPLTDPGWPREFSAKGQKLIIYQPQIDSWEDHTKLHYRAAIALTPAGQKEVYGVAEGDAETVLDEATRTVAISRKGYQLRFPGASPEEAAAYEKSVREMAPESSAMVMSLERVLASLEPDKTTQQQPVEVSLDPPKILYSAKPAVLVMFMGTPQMKPVEKEKPDLMFAVNTNWDVFFDVAESKYYLLNADNWLTATDPVKGPWTAAPQLPAGLSKLPPNENWSDVRKSIPGKKAKAIPAVFVTTEPTEMIVTQGEPAFAPIKGTKLMKVSNTESTVFMNSNDKQFYFLVAGRWFRAADLSGPWSAASKDLPPDFASIPDESPAAVVKAAVPGTGAAKDAVMLASVPRTATVKASDAKLDVTYAGEPKFEAIKGANGVQYATNSPFAVFQVSGGYYSCHKGAWYCGGTAKGPWAYCAKVPSEIFTIPSNHPMHNVTYVKVKSANGTTIVYTQTSGYSGEYVAATGVLMFGAGLLVAAALNDDCYYCHPAPYYYSYGCGAGYHYGYGGYYNSARYYGPYGGAGAGYAAYNPYTGTYSRGAYVHGPAGGSASARQAYNPYTDTYAARVTAERPDGTSGGRFYAEQGNRSAWGGHESGARGTVGWAQGSEGAKGVAWDTNRNQGVAVKGKDDNMFVANDGNVYKRDSDGNWSSPTDSKPDRPSSTQPNAAATRQSGATAQQTRAADTSARGQTASNTSARNLDRGTSASLDSAANSRQRGNAQAQSVSQVQRQGFSGGGGGRSAGARSAGRSGGSGRRR